MLIRTTYSSAVAQRQLAQAGIVARASAAGVDVHQADVARAAQILSRAKKPTAEADGEVETEAGDETEDELREKIAEQDKTIKKLRAKLKEEPEDKDADAAIAASNRRLAARASALGLDVNDLRRQVGASGRRSSTTDVGSLAALPSEFRRIVQSATGQRVDGSGLIHLDAVGVAVDVDADPASVAQLLSEMERGL